MNNANKILSHQELMDRAYAKWQDGELKGKDLGEFFEALPKIEQVAVALGNFNYQVNNGGFAQWEDNGYKLAHGKFLTNLFKNEISRIAYPHLYIGLGLIGLAKTKKQQELCDSIYYSLENIIDNMNDYLTYLQANDTYVYASCEDCGTAFEGRTQLNNEGEVACPRCKHQTQNWNDEGWVDGKPDDVVKI